MIIIGILTFHAAYNFGSSLQAYATQQAIARLGYKSHIINYRLNNQMHYYGDFLTMMFGGKEFLRRMLCLSELRARKKRAGRYEAFIRYKLQLSGKAIHTFEALTQADFPYSTLVAGSDQIWNEHCTAEFKTEPASSVLGYFLDFELNRKVNRFSFSSSLGFMKEEEIAKYLPLLKRFQHLSLREEDGAKMISKLLNVDVANTVDPTLLLSRDDWIKEFKDELETEKKGYVLFYSLEKSPKRMRFLQQRVYRFAAGRPVVCLTPFLPAMVRAVKMRNDAGPVEFLSLLLNADCMITDSFHGTAFSVNLGVPFYTVNSGRDRRKQQLLERVGLERQLIDVKHLEKMEMPSCDFQEAWKKLEQIRKESVEYLKIALQEV